MRPLFFCFGLLLAACRQEAHPPAGPAPEAEVKASSGAVKLTLALYKTRVPLSSNDSYKQAHVFFRATLTNAGREPIPADDDIFDLPEDARSDFKLEALDAQGREVDEWPFIASGGPPVTAQDGGREPFHVQEQPPDLRPGESRSTRTGVHQLSKAAPVEGYAELPFRLDKSGAYRVRLVYDKARRGSMADWRVRVATPYLPFVVE